MLAAADFYDLRVKKLALPHIACNWLVWAVVGWAVWAEPPRRRYEIVERHTGRVLLRLRDNWRPDRGPLDELEDDLARLGPEEFLEKWRGRRRPVLRGFGELAQELRQGLARRRSA